MSTLASSQLTVAVTALNATDNPGPGVSVIRALRHDPGPKLFVGPGYHLHRHPLFEVAVGPLSQVDAAHSALADLPEDPVAPHPARHLLQPGHGRPLQHAFPPAMSRQEPLHLSQ